MSFRLFAGIDEKTLAEMLKRILIMEKQFNRDDIIVYEGTKAKWLVLVLSGSVSVYESGASGDRHLVRTIETGELFGATLVTMRMEYYPGMAVAEKNCEVMFLDMAKIRGLWNDMKYRKFFENLYTIVSEYVLYCWRKMSILSCKRAEDRFMMYLNWYTSEVGEDDVTIPFATMEDCAKYLGITRTALSLAIKRLVGTGEIAKPGRSRFVLLKKN